MMKLVYVATIFGAAFGAQLVVSDALDRIWDQANKGYLCFQSSLSKGAKADLAYQQTMEGYQAQVREQSISLLKEHKW